jgi:hypothetical protein
MLTLINLSSDQDRSTMPIGSSVNDADSRYGNDSRRATAWLSRIDFYRFNKGELISRSDHRAHRAPFRRSVGL